MRRVSKKKRDGASLDTVERLQQALRKRENPQSSKRINRGLISLEVKKTHNRTTITRSHYPSSKWAETVNSDDTKYGTSAAPIDAGHFEKRIGWSTAFWGNETRLDDAVVIDL